MTAKDIEEKARREKLKFETALLIRTALDNLAAELGDDYDEDEVLEIVTGE